MDEAYPTHEVSHVVAGFGCGAEERVHDVVAAHGHDDDERHVGPVLETQRGRPNVDADPFVGVAGEFLGHLGGFLQDHSHETLNKELPYCAVFGDFGRRDGQATLSRHPHHFSVADKQGAFLAADGRLSQYGFHVPAHDHYVLQHVFHGKIIDPDQRVFTFLGGWTELICGNPDGNNIGAVDAQRGVQRYIHWVFRINRRHCSHCE